MTALQLCECFERVYRTSSLTDGKCVHRRLRVLIEREGLPPHQKVIVLLDCWSVHCSKAFLDWVMETFPWILLHFIPATKT